MKTLREYLEKLESELWLPEDAPKIERAVAEWLTEHRKIAVQNAFDEQVFTFDKLLAELEETP